MPFVGRICVLILVGSLGACVVGEDSVANDPVRSDSAGVALIRHGDLDELDVPVIDVDYQLLLESGTYGIPLFGEVVDVDLLADGSLLILDGIAAEAFIISSDGELQATIGRKGEGPGEFSGEGTLAALPLPGGEIAFPDIVNQAVSVLDTSGGFLRSYRFDIKEMYLPEWRTISGDTLAVRSISLEGERYLARSVGGEIFDTLVTLPILPNPPTAEDKRFPLMSNYWVWDAPGEGQFLAAAMNTSEVLQFDHGQLTSRLSWSDRGTALTEEEINHLVRVAVGAKDANEAAMEDMSRLLAPPDGRHVIADVKAYGDDMILVQRVRAIEQMDRRVLSTIRGMGYGGSIWDVFGRSGEYLGQLNFGANVQLFHVRGNRLIGVWETELGEAYPFVATIPRGALRTP